MTGQKALHDLIRLLEDALREELEHMGVEGIHLDRMLAELKAHAILFAVASERGARKVPKNLKGSSHLVDYALAQAAESIEAWEKRHLEVVPSPKAVKPAPAPAPDKTDKKES